MRIGVNFPCLSLVTEHSDDLSIAASDLSIKPYVRRICISLWNDEKLDKINKAFITHDSTVPLLQRIR